MYSITGHGASGGRGLYKRVKSKAGYVSATFYLTTNDQLGVIVGQQGHDACSKVAYTFSLATLCFSSKLMNLRTTPL